MQFIKNYVSLAKTPQRKVALDILEEGLLSIQPKNVLEHTFVREGNMLRVQSERLNLDNYERVFLIGFGKGSALISQIIEKTLLDKITAGYVIDTVSQEFSKVAFTKGTHPLPSEQNITFTNTVLENVKDLTERDLVLVVICGGGSAMFEAPYALDLIKLTSIFDTLLKSGADIKEMNVIRKHLSKVKGGGLAKHLYPANILSLIFSDVPGNDLSTIASGPTVKNEKTMQDVDAILAKYKVEEIAQDRSIFTENPQEEKYFKNVSNVIMLSNKTALDAMAKKAEELGYPVRIYSDHLQGDAKDVGRTLLDNTENGEILLAGGETTIHVKGNGKGGRNQTLVLSSLRFLDDHSIIVSVDSDGVDFVQNAGAIGDVHTLETVKEKALDLQLYLDDDDSLGFFEKVGDGVFTDRLESNVADLMMVLKL